MSQWHNTSLGMQHAPDSILAIQFKGSQVAGDVKVFALSPF